MRPFVSCFVCFCQAAKSDPFAKVLLVAWVVLFSSFGNAVAQTRGTDIQSQEKLIQEKQVEPFEMKDGKLVSKDATLKVPRTAILTVGPETSHEAKVGLWDYFVKMGVQKIVVKIANKLPKNRSKVEVKFYTNTPSKAFVNVEKDLKAIGAKEFVYRKLVVHWIEGTKASLEKARKKGPVICFFRAEWCLTSIAIEKEFWTDENLLLWLDENEVSVVRFDTTNSSDIEHGIEGLGEVKGIPFFVMIPPGGKFQSFDALDSNGISSKGDQVFGNLPGWKPGPKALPPLRARRRMPILDEFRKLLYEGSFL